MPLSYHASNAKIAQIENGFSLTDSKKYLFHPEKIWGEELREKTRESWANELEKSDEEKFDQFEWSKVYTIISFIVSQAIFIRRQEKILEEKYGTHYVEYKKKVKF